MPIDITMPRLSDTMEAGTIIKWNVKEGDSVSAGDVIADVETDKATMEMSVYDDGTISKLAVPEGKNVPVGTVIAVLAAKGEDAKAAPGEGKAEKREAEARKTESKVPAKAAELSKKAASEPVEQEASAVDEEEDVKPAKRHEAIAPQAEEADRQRAAGDGRLKVSPVARHMAEEYDIDLSQLQGSGPGGRIIKRDVLQAVEAAEETAAAVPPSAKPKKEEGAIERAERRGVSATRVSMEEKPSVLGAPPLEDRAIALSSMRQTIAKRLVESKTTIPHYQVTATFDMDSLIELRSKLNEQLANFGVKLSVNDFLVRCCALAMYQHPEFNASWAPEGDHLNVHGDINIGIAISIPRERGGGLVVGVIRNADQKTLRVISEESRYLSDKARTRGLTIKEMSDSTFTISNLGMFGVDNFTAIINPPNSAILAVGAAVKRPVVRNDELTVGHEMSATLSCDHRVIDGAMAAHYLQTLRQLIENPGTLLV
jgi:pyruvate dehydrogenase E2 component (dihydrolipoamide acetyltransferase)